MKNNKGVTMVSLIMYVILMVFIVAGLTSITTSFYNNISELDKDSKSAADFAKFNMILLNDLKAEEAAYESIENNGSTENPIITLNLMANGEPVSYTVQNKKLYRNDVKICGNIEKAKIEYNSSEDSITIYLKIKGYEKTTTYAIEPKIV